MTMTPMNEEEIEMVLFLLVIVVLMGLMVFIR